MMMKELTLIVFFSLTFLPFNITGESNDSINLTTLNPATCSATAGQEYHCCLTGQDFGGKVLCDPSNFTTVTAIERGYWYGNHSDTPVIGLCKFCKSFNYHKTGRFVPLNETVDQCTKNRDQSSILCSKCNPNYSIAINSDKYECLPHDDTTHGNLQNLFLYIITDVLILIALLTFIFFFNLSLASGALNPLIFFAQMTTTTLTLDMEGIIPMETAYKHDHNLSYAYHRINSIWRLDFHRWEKTFYVQELDIITVLSFKYIVATLTLIPVLVLILLAKNLYKIGNCIGKTLRWFRCSESCASTIAYCKCFKNCLWLTRLLRFNRDTSIQTLVSSCFVLSYAKFTIITFYMLAPVNLYNSSGHPIDRVLYLNGSNSATPGSISHWRVFPYIAFTVFFTIVILFPFLLFTLRYNRGARLFNNHCSKCCSNCCKYMLRYLDVFLDKCILLSFQKDLKHGLQNDSKVCSKIYLWKFSFGIHDCRWYAGWYFILRLVLFAVFIFSMNIIEQLIIQQVIVTFALAVSVAVKPYKLAAHNRLDAFILFLILVINSAIFYQYFRTISDYDGISVWVYVVEYTLSFIPTGLIVVYFFIKLYNNFKGSSTVNNDEVFIEVFYNNNNESKKWMRYFCGCQQFLDPQNVTDLSRPTSSDIESDSNEQSNLITATLTTNFYDSI